MLGRQRAGYVPLQRTGANPYWVARGLVGLYALRRGIWDINQVNGSTGGTSVGTGVTFDGSNRLVTPGVASNGARLETGLTLAQLQASAYTLLSGHEKLSGSVCLSLMGTDSSSAGNWNGVYSDGKGQWRCASNNTFDGSANNLAAGLPLETRASGLALNATSLVAAAQRLAIVDPSLTQPVSSYFIAADTAVALGWRNAYNTASDNPSVTAFTFFACFNKVLPVADLQFLTTYPDDLFVCAPRYIGSRKLWLSGAAGGSTITATTSLSAAIQIARSATAGMNVAVQAGSSATAVVNAAVQQARTASVSLAAAVQEARSATTSLNAAVQAATSTGASVNTAVQAPASASASLNTAVQQARSATPSVDAAVQAQGTAAASVNAAVQAGQGASSAVDVAIQQARAATASINTAVQASQTAAASIDAAVQAVGSATVGLNTYVQSDGAIGVSLNAAIQAQQQASAGLNLAVQLARSAASALDVVVALAQTASVSLNAYIQAPSEVTTALNAAIQDARSATISVNAAVQVQRTAQVSLSAALAVGQMLTAAVDVAVRAARSRSASLSAYIFDDSAPIPQRDFMRDISSYAAAPAPIRATLLGTSIRIHPR